MELLEILETLNRTHGPSGDEGGVREKIAELARPFAEIGRASCRERV